MQDGNVRPNDGRLTEDDWRRLQAATILRLSQAHPIGRLALDAGCDEKTMRNARDGRATLRAHTFVNLRAIDTSAFDEMLAHFGASEAVAPGALMLARVADMTAMIADAMADGRIDHVERAAIVQAARPLVQMLAAKIAAFDRERIAA